MLCCKVAFSGVYNVVQMTVVGAVMEGGFLDVYLYLSTLLF